MCHRLLCFKYGARWRSLSYLSQRLALDVMKAHTEHSYMQIGRWWDPFFPVAANLFMHCELLYNWLLYCQICYFVGEVNFLARTPIIFLHAICGKFCFFLFVKPFLAFLLVVPVFLKSMAHINGFVACLFHTATKFLLFLSWHSRENRGVEETNLFS